MEPFDPFKEFLSDIPAARRLEPAPDSVAVVVDPPAQVPAIQDEQPVSDEENPEPGDDIPQDDATPAAPPAGSGVHDFSGMRRRYEGHSPLNDLVRDDWIRAIKLSPDHFDALLYRPLPITVSAAEQAGYEIPQTGSLNTHQEELSYSPPTQVPVLDCPDEMAEFEAMDADDDSTGNPDMGLILRIGALGIPKGSIIEFEEEVNGGTRRVWWYVLNIHNYGTVGAGSLYYCVPCRTFEGIINAAE